MNDDVGPGSWPRPGGLAAMRIAAEFGGAEAFDALMDRSVARGGERGATLVAHLDKGELGIHLPRIDGPCWNAVPLLHLHRGESPTAAGWAIANAILEKLERSR